MKSTKSANIKKAAVLSTPQPHTEFKCQFYRTISTKHYTRLFKIQLPKVIFLYNLKRVLKAIWSNVQSKYFWLWKVRQEISGPDFKSIQFFKWSLPFDTFLSKLNYLLSINLKCTKTRSYIAIQKALVTFHFRPIWANGKQDRFHDCNRELVCLTLWQNLLKRLG